MKQIQFSLGFADNWLLSPSEFADMPWHGLSYASWSIFALHSQVDHSENYIFTREGKGSCRKKNQNVNFFQKGGGGGQPQSSHFFFIFF